MNPPDFTKMVPGFDFLQNLMKGAGSSLPGMSQWIAPTLDPDEVDQRIRELRTVQFWLEQNVRMLGTTIQALEVQRMSLATLKAMNVPMRELRDSMKLDPAAFMPRAAEPEPPAPPPASKPEPAADAEPKARRSARTPKSGAAAPAAAGVVDPMQWWGALTRQFTELAGQAMKDMPAEAAQLAGSALQKAVRPMADAMASAAQAKPAKAAPARRPGAAKKSVARPATKAATARRR